MYNATSIIELKYLNCYFLFILDFERQERAEEIITTFVHLLKNFHIFF